MYETGLFVELARLVNNSGFTWTYSAAIATFATVSAIWLFAKIRSLRSPLNKAISALRRLSGPDGDIDYIDEVWDSFTELKPLQPHWEHYHRGLRGPQPPFIRGWFSTAPAQVHFNAENLIHARLNTSWWNAVPNILTGLGILGTFLGLSAGISMAQLGEQTTDVSALRESLGNLMSGASLAFVTSLVGLSTSLVFTVFHRTWIRGLEGRVDDLVSAADKAFPPRSLEDLTNDQLAQQLQQTDLLRKFNTDFATQLGDAIDQRLGPGFIEIVEHLKGMRGDRQQADNETMMKIVSNFKEALTGAAGAEMKGMADTLVALQQTLDGTATTLADAARSWESILARTTDSFDRLETFSSTLDGLHERLQGTLEETTRSIDSMGTSLEEFARISEANQGSAQRIENSTARLVEASDETSAHWAGYIDRFSQTDESLAVTFDRLQDGWQRYASEIEKYLVQLDTHTGTAVESLGAVVNQLHESLVDLPDRLREVERALQVIDVA